jgi:hypothetical protein
MTPAVDHACDGENREKCGSGLFRGAKKGQKRSKKRGWLDDWG